MRALALVLLAGLAGPAAAQTGREVAPVVVTAGAKPPPADVTLVVAGEADPLRTEGAAVWPAGALEAGLRGEVTLTCTVNVAGLAERCRIAYETPHGHRFGDAALALRPTLKLEPRQGAQGPVESEMNIAIRFEPPRRASNLSEVMEAPLVGMAGIRSRGPIGLTQSGSDAAGHHDVAVPNAPASGARRPRNRVTVMDAPVWVEAPGFEELAAAYPAQAGGVEGFAVAHCRVEPSGALSRCRSARELPAGAGFGEAAVALAARFRVSPEALAQAPRGAPVEVDVPIRFPPPAEAARRELGAPLWIAGTEPENIRRFFPAEAAAKGITSGAAVVRCGVTAQGGLADCSVQLAKPDGYGFDEAAVKLASTLRMNLWSGEATPVRGADVLVRLEFDAATP